MFKDGHKLNLKFIHGEYFEPEPQEHKILIKRTLEEGRVLMDWAKTNIENSWSFRTVEVSEPWYAPDPIFISEFSFADLQDAVLFRLGF